MQYKKAIKCNIIRSGSFICTQDLFLHTREQLKTFEIWSFSSRSSPAWFSIHIIWYFGWCQSPFSSSFAAVEKCNTLSKAMQNTWHAVWPSIQAVSTASSISNRSPQKRENKQTWYEANTGVISFTNGGFQSWRKQTRETFAIPDPSLTKASYIFGTKKKTFHLLLLVTFFLPLFYVAVPSKIKSNSLTFSVRDRKVLSKFNTFSSTTSFFYTLSISL